MQNRSLAWLKVHGHCLDLVQKNLDGTTVAKTAIQQGKPISVMPLFATHLNSQQQIANETCSMRPACFGHANSSVRLCPMLAPAYLTHTSNASQANAEYQWSMWNKANFVSHGTSAHEVLSETAHVISFDILATKPIDPGEEIVLDIGEHPVSDFVPVHAGMFAEHWLEAHEKEEENAEMEPETGQLSTA